MNFKALSLKYVLAAFLLLISVRVSAQKKEQAHIGSLLRQLTSAKADTNKVNLIIKLGQSYSTLKKADSAIFYLQRALLLSQQLQWKKGVARSYYYLGYHYNKQGDYIKAQNYLKQAIELNFDAGDYQFAYKSVRALVNTLYFLKKYPDAVSYALSAAGRFKKNNQTGPLINTYMLIGECYSHEFNYNTAIDYYNNALKLQEGTQHNYLKAFDMVDVANLYLQVHDVRNARVTFQRGTRIAEQAGSERDLIDTYIGLAHCADAEHDMAGAMIYYNKCLQAAQKVNDYSNLCATENEISWDYFVKKDYENAMLHGKRATAYVKADSAILVYALSTLGSVYRDAPNSVITRTGVKPGQKYERSLALLLEGLKYGEAHPDFDLENESWRELSLTYEKMNRYPDAFKAYRRYITQRDSADSLKNEKAVLLKEAQLNYSHKEDSLKFQQNITSAQLKQKKQQSYFFIGGIAVLLILSLFIWLNFNNQRKSNKLLTEANDQITNANHELSEQREEITVQRDQLSNTVSSLKAAQQQLIQSEKMASLGELTAGIAHEIQNPLNFVNNFSEVSAELVDEMDEELDKGDIAEARAIGADLKQNLEKIRHHGKRADNIVKGMLEHSGASTGQKEPTDLNKLADEYLRLAYHGLRAKDKTFNAELITHFDPDPPLVNIIPQDIGRVLLNLFNNAFYAVQQKAKTGEVDYKPEITVTTYFLPLQGAGGLIVRDNGNGISDSIKEKIMQPFFTTKPTGEGTGLGLSLSYDIVVKGHGGKIDVNTKEGEYTELIIRLPVA